MTTRRITSTLWALPALLVAAAAHLPAQTAHPVLSGFAPIDDYILEIDGEADTGARLYLSQRAASMLILSDALGEPILLWARSMAVDQLQGSDLLTSGPGYDVVAEPDKTYLGEATPDQTTIVLPIEGRDVKVLPRPPLVGDRTLGELLEHSPGYRAGMGRFPAERRRHGRTPRQRSGTGPECSSAPGAACANRCCRTSSRVNAGLEGTQVTFEYYGLASPPAGWEDPEVKSNEVTGLPMAIVYRDGREVGRFGGANEFAQPARVLQALLASAR